MAKYAQRGDNDATVERMERDCQRADEAHDNGGTMDADLKIPEIDRERIEQIVSSFRTRIENLYRIAYLQGQIEQEEKERDKLIRKMKALA